jgi:hypothetical protein
MSARRKTTRWVKQWRVPSDSDPDKAYIVSLDADGRYACHCWPFLRTRAECKHIRHVLDGDVPAVGEDAQPEPKIVLCDVREVTPVRKGGQVIRLKTPLVPFGEGDASHFALTVLHDLARFGVRWATLRERYCLNKTLTRERVDDYIRAHGRLIYGAWQEGQGYVGYTHLPPQGD